MDVVGADGGVAAARAGCIVAVVRVHGVVRVEGVAALLSLAPASSSASSSAARGGAVDVDFVGRPGSRRPRPTSSSPTRNPPHPTLKSHQALTLQTSSPPGRDEGQNRDQPARPTSRRHKRCERDLVHVQQPPEPTLRAPVRRPLRSAARSISAAKARARCES